MATAGQTAAASKWDLAWVDDLKGKHMQVYDMADADPSSAPPPLRLPRNYMDAFRDVMHMEFPEVRTLVGIAGGKAFTLNASHRLWEKYGLGERFKITDPATKAPAVRNIFMDEPTLGVTALNGARHHLLAMRHRAWQRGGPVGHREEPSCRRSARGPGRRSQSRRQAGAVARDGDGPGAGAGRHLREALTAPSSARRDNHPTLGMAALARL